MAIAKAGQLLEHGEDHLEKLHNLQQYEESFGSSLFEHFLDATASRPLFEGLQNLAEKFISTLYPRGDARVRGRPRFTFNVRDLKLTGFAGYSKNYGVSKSVYQEVSLSLRFLCELVVSRTIFVSIYNQSEILSVIIKHHYSRD